MNEALMDRLKSFFHQEDKRTLVGTPARNIFMSGDRISPFMNHITAFGLF